MAEETFYFKHKTNARNDRKLVSLSIEHGLAGIGAYWCIVEMLYEENAYIPRNYKKISIELRTKENLVKSIIEDFDLFTFNDTHIGCDAVKKQLQARMKKSDTLRQNVNIHWDKVKNSKQK